MTADGPPRRDRFPAPSRRDETDITPIQLSNEFAQVVVQKVYTKKRERLQVTSPKLDYSVRIDAIALETLTWQDEALVQ